MFITVSPFTMEALLIQAYEALLIQAYEALSLTVQSACLAADEISWQAY